MNYIPHSPSLNYQQGVLHSEGVDLAAIAKAVGTPSYVYSRAAIQSAHARISAALRGLPATIAYAAKANGHLAILSELKTLGCGADIVSIGELQRAQQSGIAAERIVFSGVGKDSEEISAALKAGIHAIHVESEAELHAIAEIAQGLGVQAPIALRINPDIDPQTHPYIATGLRDAKFGMSSDAACALLPMIKSTPSLNLIGLACHIGSQIGAASAMRDAVQHVASLALHCINAGHALSMLDVGGGWPISYGDETTPMPTYDAFGDAIRAGLAQAGVEPTRFALWVEPGRALVGNAGLLLSRVIYLKHNGQTHFAVLDAAMTELIRPPLYQAFHSVTPYRQASTEQSRQPYDLVGPVCESADYIAQGRELPTLAANDLLAIGSCGAYAAVMSMSYNARPRAAEVMVDGRDYHCITARQSLESLWEKEQVPNFAQP